MNCQYVWALQSHGVKRQKPYLLLFGLSWNNCKSQKKPQRIKRLGLSQPYTLSHWVAWIRYKTLTTSELHIVFLRQKWHHWPPTVVLRLICERYWMWNHIVLKIYDAVRFLLWGWVFRVRCYLLNKICHYILRTYTLLSL